MPPYCRQRLHSLTFTRMLSGDKKRSIRPSSINEAINDYLIHSQPLQQWVPQPPPPRGVTIVDKLKLEKIEYNRDLLRKAKVPFDGQTFPPIIHVAGTKGKGSTSSFTESILRLNGLRTGLFTSPHLVDFRERIRIDGELVDKETFENHFWAVWDILSRNGEATRDEMPGFFQFLFVVGMKIFSSLQPPLDVIILECGMGGRLDATNAIEPPACCIITRIDLDHTEFLGKTLAAIAREKAGIIKPGLNVYTPAAQDSSVLEVFTEVCEDVGASLILVPEHVTRDMNVSLGIDGPYQHENASLAVMASKFFLSKQTRAIDASISTEQNIVKGLESCRWPGRCQQISKDGIDYFLDGAHTPASMENAMLWFESKIADRSYDKKILVFYCSHNRDIGPLLHRVSLTSTFHLAIFCPVRAHRPTLVSVPLVKDILASAGVDYPALNSDDNDDQESKKSWQVRMRDAWSVMYKKSHPAAKDICEAIALNDVEKIRDHLQLLGKEEKTAVLVTGSLLLVGDFMDSILGWKADQNS